MFGNQPKLRHLLAKIILLCHARRLSLAPNPAHNWFVHCIFHTFERRALLRTVVFLLRPPKRYTKKRYPRDVRTLDKEFMEAAIYNIYIYIYIEHTKNLGCRFHTRCHTPGFIPGFISGFITRFHTPVSYPVSYPASYPFSYQPPHTYRDFVCSGFTPRLHTRFHTPASYPVSYPVGKRGGFIPPKQNTPYIYI